MYKWNRLEFVLQHENFLLIIDVNQFFSAVLFNVNIYQLIPEPLFSVFNVNFYPINSKWQLSITVALMTFKSVLL